MNIDHVAMYVNDLEKAKEDIAIQVASAYLKVLLTQELKQVAINQVELSSCREITDFDVEFNNRSVAVPINR